MSEPSTPCFPDFSKLERVQDILDRNKHLLYVIKANQESQKPEGLVRNFSLIREVNANIDKVIKLYAQLSEDYVSFMSQQRRDSGSEPGSDDAYQPG